MGIVGCSDGSLDRGNGECRAVSRRARETIRWRAREHVHDQRIESSRQCGIEVAHVRRRLVQPTANHLLAGIGRERLRPGEHLVQNAAEAVDVGALVDRIAEQLLRAHVLRRADHQPAPRERILRRLGDRFGDTEVDDFRDLFPAPRVRENHVVGFEVAMDDSELVRGRQSVGHLTRDLDRASRIERAVACDHGRQRVAVHVLHHEVDDLVGFAVVEHGGDVRMENARSVRRFARESLQ